MKIQCNVCEASEATVLCCADEAALCSECDEKIHAANKLAGKHQRVPLNSSSSNMPKCDICQDTVGYFFCLEDRALLCRKCDLAIHTANSYVSIHQRFLLTGVKVGLEGATEMVGGPSSARKSLSVEKRSETKPHTVTKRDAPMLSVDEYKLSSIDVSVGRDIPPSKVSYTGGSATECFPQWNIDEYMGIADFNSGYDYIGNGGSSKADSGKFGESGSPALRSGGEDLDGDEYSSQVPEASWTVPQIPSPPTASGLYWPRNSYRSSEFAAFVPDVCSSEMQNQSSDTLSKRRRQY